MWKFRWQWAAVVRGARTAIATAVEPACWLAAIHISMLSLHLPLLSMLPGWFFPLNVKPLGPWYLIASLAVVLFIGLRIGRRQRTRPGIALGALVVLGFVLQQGFAWSEGRELDGMRDRIIKSGHAEFARIAVQQDSMWDVLTGYEGKVKSGELGRFAHSKPPGQLLFYMLTERLARGLGPQAATDPDARWKAECTYAAVVWPLLSYLVLFPLFFLLREFEGEDIALLACVLYVATPAVTLITLHTDQVLFPGLFMTTVWMAATAQRKRSWLWAVATGAAFYVSGFFTFALLLGVPVAAGFAVAVEAQVVERDKSPMRTRSLIATALGIVVGFGMSFAVFAWLVNYDFLARLRDATLFHENWKQWRGGVHDTVYFAWLNYLEFAVFLGVPVAVLALGRIRRAILLATTGAGRALVPPAIATLGVFLYLGFCTHTQGETARLWLPMAPMCCALAASELHERSATSDGFMITVVLALQWLTIWLTKAGQDFW